MKQEVIFSRLSVDQLLSFSKSCKSIIETYISDDPVFISLDTELDAKIETYATLVKKVDTKVLTQQLSQLDSEEDDITIGMFKYVDAMAYSKDLGQKLSSQRIQAVIERYGRQVYRKPRKEQSALTLKLIQELESGFASDLTAINANFWVEWLKEYETALADKNAERTNLKASRPKDAASESAKPLIEALEKMFQYLEILATVMNNETAQQICQQLEVVISDVNSEIRARQTRNSNEEETVEEITNE